MTRARLLAGALTWVVGGGLLGGGAALYQARTAEETGREAEWLNGHEFPTASPSDLNEAWALLEAVPWVHAVRARHPNVEPVSWPTTEGGEPVGVFLQLSVPEFFELSGPLILSACGNRGFTWEPASRVKVPGLVAYLDLREAQVLQLLPLRQDGQMPTDADLRSLGGAVRSRPTGNVETISEFLDRSQTC